MQGQKTIPHNKCKSYCYKVAHTKEDFEKENSEKLEIIKAQFLAVAEHAKLYPDLVQALRRELLIALRSQQKRL